MFTTEVFESSLAGWEKIKERIIYLEKEAFGENAFPDSEIETEFLNKNNLIILLKDDLGEVIGNVYAKPIEEAEIDRKEEKGETMYIWNITVDKKYRGQHLGALLMNKIEEELLKMNYKYMDLDAVTAHNFASNISKVYKERIIKSEPHDSKWGSQIYFRIRLGN